MAVPVSSVQAGLSCLGHTLDKAIPLFNPKNPRCVYLLAPHGSASAAGVQEAAWQAPPVAACSSRRPLAQLRCHQEGRGQCLPSALAIFSCLGEPELLTLKKLTL